MNTSRDRIEVVIGQVLAKASSWIRNIDGELQFVDPIDGIEVSAHYGATHMAASMILWGTHHQDASVRNKGLALLESILDRWDANVKLPAFHFDFNNFALCLVYDTLDNRDEDLKKRICSTIVRTPDSNHQTVNWLPMRMIVNQHRYEWTGNDVFIAKAKECAAQIKKATYPDGGIDDRLPRGISFNLQYDLATVAVLQYANIRGRSESIEKELGFLLKAVAPDGDINYQGRGTNQIFAWGLWIYLLAASGQEEMLSLALDYLEARLGIMLDNNNMMLNEWSGDEKYLWWDYHYASVYTAHLLLWLVLAYQDIGKQKVIAKIPETSDTGLHIYRSDKFFVSWFEGRNEYLSEKGPAVSCIWSKNAGVICKGAFAPWHGAFGNNHSFDIVSLANYCGLLEDQSNKDISKNRIIHRLFPSASPKIFWLRESPVFCPLEVTESDGALTITWRYEGKGAVVLNVPSVLDSPQCEVLADGKLQPLMLIGRIRNQYGWVNVFRTRPMNVSQISITIEQSWKNSFR